MKKIAPWCVLTFVLFGLASWLVAGSYPVASLWKTNADNTISPVDNRAVSIGATLQARMAIIDAHATGNLSAADVSGTLHHNVGQGANDCTKTLPLAASVPGANFKARAGETVAANKWKYLAAGSDVMYLDGVAGTGGHGIKVNPTLGDSLVCISIPEGAGYVWDCVSSGPWVVE